MNPVPREATDRKYETVTLRLASDLQQKCQRARKGREEVGVETV